VLSNPAPGVMVHLVVEQNGQVVRCIKMNAREDKALTLLP